MPTEGKYLAVLGECTMVLYCGSFFRFPDDLLIFNMLVFIFPSPAQTSNAIPLRSLFLLPSRLCIPFFDSLNFWTPVPQKFLVPQEFPSSFLGNHCPHSLFLRGWFLGNSLSWEFPFCTFLPRCPDSGSLMAMGSDGNKKPALVLLG